MSNSLEPQIIEIGNTSELLSVSIPSSAPAPTSVGAPTPPGSPAPKQSVNFGPGVELLMNDKRKQEKSPRTPGGEPATAASIDAQLDQIGSSKAPSKSGLFNQALQAGAPSSSAPGLSEVSLDVQSLGGGDSLRLGESTPAIGKATADSASAARKDTDRTWDGFAPFGDVPVDPDNSPAPPPLSPEETLRQKFKVLRDLEQLERKGVSLSKQYTMESSLQEMQGEYETIVAEREKKTSSKFQGRMLMAAVTGLEFLNNRFDPFDVKLDGWAEQIGENLDDYDEIFGELHEKYKSKAKMAPEIKLMFQLAGSAIMVHMTNSMFKSSVPGMDDIMRQNPELMQQFSQAAASSMSQSAPGLAGFMQDLGGMGGGPSARPPPPPPNAVHGPPPAAMRTKNPPRSQGARPSNRPDLQAARGGVDVRDNHAPATRAEMRGPSDIGSILSGLKTKTIDVPERGAAAADQSSTISVQELKELSRSKAPPRSKKRGTSNRNTVSLEL